MICNTVLEEAGLEISEADNAETGFQKVRSEDPDLVILDVPTQRGFRVRNLSGAYILCRAARPSECRGIPGLRRWKRPFDLETFCSTPEENATRRRAT